MRPLDLDSTMVAKYRERAGAVKRALESVGLNADCALIGWIRELARNQNKLNARSLTRARDVNRLNYVCIL